MWKIQIAISSDLCIRLTWNLTGSCGQQQRLCGWSRMVVKQFQDGGRPPFWKSPYLGEKSSDFHEILYTAADFELDEHHVIKNEKVALDRLRVRQHVFLVAKTFSYIMCSICISFSQQSCSVSKGRRWEWLVRCRVYSAYRRAVSVVVTGAAVAGVLCTHCNIAL